MGSMPLLVAFVLLNARLVSSIKWDVYSTKTIYEWSHQIADPAVDAEYVKIDGDNTCKAVHIYMVTRHGSRWPTDGSTDEINELVAFLKSNVTGQHQQAVQDWNLSYTQTNAEHLCEVGIQEQLDIGRRVGLKLKTLLTRQKENLKFVSSRKDRNIDSTVNFHKGLNETLDNIGALVNEINVTLMRYYDGCTHYEEQVEDNSTQMAEFLTFEASDEFKAIAAKLKTGLGLPRDLTQDEVYLFWELCSYDKYLFNVTSIWCDLLTDEDRMVLEYGQDLENYYEKANTHPIIRKMTCPLVGDMFTTMDAAMNESWDYENLPDEAIQNGYLAGKFLDGHSTTVVTFMTALGLYQDDPALLASNRQSQSNRVFKTSHIAPFSTNVALVLYACRPTATPSANNEFKVQLLVNEVATMVPGCDSMLCPYNQVRAMHTDLINNCDLNEICFGPTTTTSAPNIESTTPKDGAVTYSLSTVLLCTAIFSVVFV